MGKMSPQVNILLGLVDDVNETVVNRTWDLKVSSQ
jgi:hypothetical protein